MRLFIISGNLCIIFKSIIIFVLRLSQRLLGFSLSLDSFGILARCRFRQRLLLERNNILVNRFRNLVERLYHFIIVLNKSICCQTVLGSHRIIQLI